MSESDQKTVPSSATEVSEDEAGLDRPGPDGDSVQSAYGPASDRAGSEAPDAPRLSGSKPPPLPSLRRRFRRPRAAQVIGFLALCTALGLGIGLIWNLVFAPESEQAPSAGETGPEQGAEAPVGDKPEAAGVEIRLGEMVVTSEEEEEGDGSETEGSDAEQ